MNEMKQQFTPGPWDFPLYAMSEENRLEAEKLGLTVSRFAHNDGSVNVMAGSGDDREVIAHVRCLTQFKRGEGHKAICAERDANARLIAAAPDLLEVAHACLAMVEDGAGPPDWDWIRSVISRATAIERGLKPEA